MINGKNVLAVIPARGGSKGLPGKNIKILCGKPLIAWPIQVAKDSAYIDKIIVSTDDLEIADVAISEGIQIPFLRPPELATDKSVAEDAIVHVIDILTMQGEEYDYCVKLEATSPLTESSDVDKALELLDSNRVKADSIVGVSEIIGAHPDYTASINRDGMISPYFGKEFTKAVNRQEINKLYFYDGTLYISEIKALKNNKSFYHNRTMPYIAPKWKSLEVDDLTDFICIEAIINNLDQIKGKQK
jgi:CMP-N,N'-diacetyllegionaminic acid synthase